MPRQIRREYEGAIYHVMSRGDRLEKIYDDDEDRKIFLKTLGETCGRAGWEIHAYCLMSNHFHLVMETPQPTLVAGMKWLLGTYTLRYNGRHRQRGHVFAGRYKSLLVDGKKGDYLRVVSDYVHLNPVRAGLLKSGERLEEYEWSSYPQYLKAAGKRVHWLRADRVLGEHGILRDSARGRREFAQIMEARLQPDEESLRKIRRGWRFGEDDFLERMGDLETSPTKRENYLGREYGEAMEVKGRRVIAEELKKLGGESSALARMNRTCAIKGAIAKKLRSETTLTLKWIANELFAGTAGTLANTIRKLNVVTI